MSDVNNTTTNNGSQPSPTDVIISKLAENKVGSWGSKNENFVIPTELTVTITLGEYRSLVGKVAEADYKFARKEEECNALKKSIAELNKKIEGLQTAIDTLRGNQAPTSEGSDNG